MITSDAYEDLIKWCRNRIFFKRIQDHMDPVDLAHDVIAHEDFTGENYKPVADKLIYEQFKHLKKNISFNEHAQTKLTPEELWKCETCGSDIPKSYYQLSWKDCNSCYRKKNAERIKAVNLRSYLKHHEKRKSEKRANDKRNRKLNGDAIRARDREYYAKNKEKILAKNKKCYENNREKRLVYMRDWYKKNSLKKGNSRD